MDLARDCSTAETAWVQSEDSLMGPVPPPEPSEGVIGTMAARSRRAVGIARVTRTPLDSSLSLWTASTGDVLQLRLRASATSDDVAEVLDAWLALPAAAPEPGGDHARLLRIPVAARQVILPLIERGFVPATATLARGVRPDDAPRPPGVVLRSATPQDREPMRVLMRELLATEAAFGAVRERPGDLGDHYVDDALRFGAGWLVIAEAEGVPIGWASLAPPESSAWAAPSVSAGPVVYLGIAAVTAACRSGGVGRALAAALHSQAARAGAAVSVLDASVLNPWSVPFWHRHGYRPLWTTWHRRTPIT